MIQNSLLALQNSGLTSSTGSQGSLLIKILLIISVLVIAFFLVRSTANTKNVAVRRLLLVVFVIIAVLSILFPDITTRVAQFLGVGRGADLILYLVVIAFLSYAVVSYRRMNIFENRITDLARELAIARSQPELLAPKPEGEEQPSDNVEAEGTDDFDDQAR